MLNKVKLGRRETYNIRVVPKASRNLVKKEAGGFKVYLTKPAYEGHANEQLIDLLADFFGVRSYQIRIINGLKARNKIVEITRTG